MNTTPSALPTTTDEMEMHLSKVFGDESLNVGLAFQPHPSDIIISPYAKCGTTWLQQVAHGLRTRGSMDFEEVTDVVPWLEIAAELGVDLDADHVAEPRVFKSHFNWDEVPKGARYIVSFRNPTNAFISFFRFFEGFMFERGAIDLETFFEWRNPPAEMGEHGYWQHLASWWEQRDNPDILLLCYEDMLADFDDTVRRIAHFMGIPLDDELHAKVVHQSSRQFMLAHKNQFDEAPFRRLIAERTGVPVGTEAAKVTPGARDDAGYQLSAAQKRTLEEIWRTQVSEPFGLQTYDDLRQAVRALHQSR